MEFDFHEIVEGAKSITKWSMLNTMAAVFDPF